MLKRCLPSGWRKRKSETVAVVKGDKGANMDTFTANNSVEKLSEIQQFAESEMVDIHVGTDEKLGHFKVHKSILCQKVLYFEKMFNENFLESATNSTNLPENDPKDFNILMSWIYSGQLPVVNEKHGDPFNWSLHELYSLADKLCLPKFMDQILDAALFAMRDKWIPDIPMLQKMQDYSPRKSCGLFRLICSCICFILCSIPEKTTINHWPTEDIDSFLVRNDDLRHEVFRRLRAQSVGIKYLDPRIPPYCQFHEHAKGEPCSQRM
ncbi:hypothetical protein SBOR_4685 [Sclerotinia borealis F-4128]|uniref:BTB domain-containing protein n=1 Tax=Sclerotinia borealis (strain F-4128) TaxID=1432307 RepID=W9CGD7_SCLBF|nr:hypothetical protein SBOR_4685 [Sclerotinia borealis F-4128]